VILLYCTSRGTHQRVDLYELHPRAGLIGLRPGHRSDARYSQQFHEESPGKRLRMECPRCPRRPVWTAVRAIQIYDAATAGGMSELDLSYLD
jgi:hypothetical protein